MSTDTGLNAQGCSLLSLLMQYKLQLLSSTNQLSCHITSMGGSGPESTTPLVDYAITSYAAAPWVIGMMVGDAWLPLSDHCPLSLCLALPAPLTPPVSLVPTLCIHWEPGMQACWQVHLSSPSFPACLQETISHEESQSEVAAMNALLLEACQEVGLTRAPCLQNPNQNCKHCPAQFDDSRQVIQSAAWAATREHDRHAAVALAARQAFHLACQKAAHADHVQLIHLLKEHPADIWRLLSPPHALLGATAQDQASHFEAILHCRDLEALVAPTVVPLDPP